MEINNPTTSLTIEGRSRLKLWLGSIVAATAFFLYANTLHHQYVLDDYSVIKENRMTKKGVSGIGEIFKSGYRSGYFFIDKKIYRPLSKAMFAVEWQLSPDNPSLSHWINVLLYSLSCLLLFHVLSWFFSENLLLAFVASLLFAAHPIHTEVVANIKSRDEILCFLFLLLTVRSVYKYVEGRSDGIALSQMANAFNLFLSAVFFAAALFSNESGLTFLAAISLIIYFFTNGSMNRNIVAMLALCVVASFYLIIRYRILWNDFNEIKIVENYLVSINDPITQKTSAIYLLGLYLKLLVFPHPLVYDGSYHQYPIVSSGDWRFLLAFLVFILLISYAIVNIKKKNVICFSILYFFITVSIVSNVFFLTETNYGERLMYIPSLGYCMAFSVLIARYLRNNTINESTVTLAVFFKTNLRAIAVAALIIFPFSIKTISRNKDWHDNLTLYSKDVKLVPESAKAHLNLGNYIGRIELLDSIENDLEREKVNNKSLEEINRAIEIYPFYSDAYVSLGNFYMKDSKFVLAEPFYEKGLKLDSINTVGLSNYGMLLLLTGRNEAAKVKFDLDVKYNPYNANSFNNLGKICGTFGENFINMSDLNYKNGFKKEAKENRDTAMKHFNSAVYYFKQAIQIDPDYPRSYLLLAKTYTNLGEEEMAKKYNEIYEKMNK